MRSKFPKTREEIIELVAEEHDIPYKQAKTIINDFWLAIRHYLSNPTESKGGIYIPGLMTMYISKHKMEKYKDREPFFEELLEQIEFYEQKRKKEK